MWEVASWGPYCTPERHCQLWPALLQRTPNSKHCSTTSPPREALKTWYAHVKAAIIPRQWQGNRKSSSESKAIKERLLQHVARRHLLESPPGFLYCPSLTNHTLSPKRLCPGESSTQQNPTKHPRCLRCKGWVFWRRYYVNQCFQPYRGQEKAVGKAGIRDDLSKTSIFLLF